MPSCTDSAALILIEEAAILCEAAERDFAQLREDIQKTLRTSGVLTTQAILDRARARQRFLEARIGLWEQVKRRDPKSVTACYCKGRLWVCKKNPTLALDECHGRDIAVPCSCNPYRKPPPGYRLRAGARQIWESPSSIRCYDRRTL